MAMVNLDFTNVPSREALEEGVYALTILECEEATSSGGNPMLKITFKVEDVEGDRRLWDNLVLIDKCLWRVKEFCDALGMDTKEICEFDPAELVGSTLNAKVIQEEYNGETINRVKKYMVG